MEATLLIYCKKITPRIQYIFDFILSEFSGIGFVLTTDKHQFIASQSLKINHSNEKFTDEIHLISDEFLFEEGISNEVSYHTLHDIGKIFYNLTRYEEYLPQKKDQHKRISGRGKVHKVPFVDQWIIQFQNTLKEKYPSLQFKKRQFNLTITCDVDQIWKYRNKGGIRTVGAFAKDMLRFDWKEISNRYKSLAHLEKDPYDTFDYFKKWQEKRNFEMIFFWLMADYGKFDKNNPVNNPTVQTKIKEVSSWSTAGIHPSYASNSSPEKLKIEIRRLSEILGYPIYKSRQHYIILHFPETYRTLIQHGIQEDFSMAYADETGFRAGSCTPFYWFDLERNETTDLKIFPFCAMDVTMRNYMKLSPEKAIDEIHRLKSEIQNVNGEMQVLFHNSNLTNDWSNWKPVFENLWDKT